jgi:hypothetical protein
MPRTIWKYRLTAMDTCILEMPQAARLLSVQEQFGAPVVWALVDPDATKVMRRLTLCPTGAPLPCEVEGFAFVGTFQIEGGSLVFHLFDAGEM